MPADQLAVTDRPEMAPSLRHSPLWRQVHRDPLFGAMVCVLSALLALSLLPVVSRTALAAFIAT